MDNYTDPMAQIHNPDNECKTASVPDTSTEPNAIDYATDADSESIELDNLFDECESASGSPSSAESPPTSTEKPTVCEPLGLIDPPSVASNTMTQDAASSVLPVAASVQHHNGHEYTFRIFTSEALHVGLESFAEQYNLNRILNEPVLQKVEPASVSSSTPPQTNMHFTDAQVAATTGLPHYPLVENNPGRDIMFYNNNSWSSLPRKNQVALRPVSTNLSVNNGSQRGSLPVLGVSQQEPYATYGYSAPLQACNNLMANNVVNPTFSTLPQSSSPTIRRRHSHSQETARGKIFNCKVPGCNATLVHGSRANGIKQHMITEHGLIKGQRYQCPIAVDKDGLQLCNELLEFECVLRHIVTTKNHLHQTVPCRHCGKGLSRADALSRHERGCKAKARLFRQPREERGNVFAAQGQGYSQLIQ